MPVSTPHSLPDTPDDQPHSRVAQNQENQISSSTCATKPAESESNAMQITPLANLGHDRERHEPGSEAEEHRWHVVDIHRHAGQETSKAAKRDRMPCSSSNCNICHTL
ncbi:hypothetical protein [Methanocella sp. MCL-LM]|uniref:hypothetical protein n=1 Tax=Methanocella sp. MCL-LM TaxID=3412035 RepID=UPI003C783DDB